MIKCYYSQPQTKAALAAANMRSMDGLWHESGEAVNSNDKTTISKTKQIKMRCSGKERST